MFARPLAAMLLAVLSPIIGVVGVLIKCVSPGPALYCARRAGRHGRCFTMYKMRSMHDSSFVGDPISGSADPRVFPLGRWIRRLKIDEFPQLFNVARGEMSFFGPRPEDPEVVAKYFRPWMMETLSVRPGIVGPGSLSYFLEEGAIPSQPEAALTHYVEVLLPAKLARDLVYVRNSSSTYRALLLTRTVLGIVGMKGLSNRLAGDEILQALEIMRQVQEEGDRE